MDVLANQLARLWPGRKLEEAGRIFRLIQGVYQSDLVKILFVRGERHKSHHSGARVQCDDALEERGAESRPPVTPHGSVRYSRPFRLSNCRGI